MKERCQTKTLAGKFEEIVRHGIIYGFGSVLRPLISFLLLPLYTSYLTTTQYGVLGLLTATSVVLGVFIHISLSSALFRSYFDYPDQMNRKIVVSTAFVLIFISSCFACCLVFFFAGNLSLLLFGHTGYRYHLIIVTVYTALSLLGEMAFVVIRAKKKSVQYVVLQVAFFLVGISATIYFVATKHLGVLGVLLGNLAMAFVSVFVLGIFVRQDIVFRFSRLELRKLLRYGLPLIPTGLCAFVFHYLDRYLLTFYASLHEVGLYNLGYQFGMVITILLITPMKSIWAPMFLSAKDDPNAKEFYSRMLTYFIFIGSILFLVISLLSREAIRLLTTQEYWGAYAVVPFVTLAYVIWGLRSIIDVGIYLKRRTEISLLYSFLGAVTNVAMNFLMIPKWGMIGGAYATLISFTMMIVASFYLNRRLMRIDYEWRRVLKIISAAVFVFAIGSHVVTGCLWLSILFKAGIILTMPFILVLLGFYTDIELKKIKGFLRLAR